ncbi:palmitoyltransferase pfa4 [Metarhizium rileyi]|uniref:Palmitoyltransferase PFA4 n=1 Tax=Metarhizium rileyi (strain RCEF 4871) TaxID=1649241 RepID=A0A166W2S8_METRR|nr:palmitoyltransferase pfa4 [Metarhizium rileyi RCEF 4871]TWU75503.1 Palmitoyltransferase [Metarhizium rileyi]
MTGLNDAPFVQSIAVPAVCILIAFLGYFPQYLFRHSSLEPGPPSFRETAVFNGLLTFLWLTYYKAVSEDPGRYLFADKAIKTEAEADGNWCRKCSAPKPARAHHCRHCGRCIPKMDHHCPWTANCVSMTTFPHFLRFLLFANMSLWALGYLLWQRIFALWESRHLPAYLGPTLEALVGLALTSLVCLFTSLALAIMLATTVKSWLFNCTMIEGWQMERHDVVMGRGGQDWWDMSGPDGEKVRVERVEFPYDLGFFANMAQAMGSSNFLLWFSPFSGSPKVGRDGLGCGWSWEENGFNRNEGMWPPPDPEKIRKANRLWPAARRDLEAELRNAEAMSEEEQKRTFKERQLQDMQRRNILMTELEELDDCGMMYGNSDCNGSGSDEESSWRNNDGERLQDFGVDEDAELCTTHQTTHDDHVPLGELLRRRNIMRSPSVG